MIEKLRAEHIVREKYKEDLLEKIRKSRSNARCAKIQRLKNIKKGYKDFTMNFTGELLPLIPFPFNKYEKNTKWGITPKVIKEAIINDTTNNSLHNKTTFTVDKSRSALKVKSENTESSLSKYQDNLNIKPSIGVTLKIGNEVRYGSFIEDDSLESHKAKIEGKSKSIEPRYKPMQENNELDAKQKNKLKRVLNIKTSLDKSLIGLLPTSTPSKKLRQFSFTPQTVKPRIIVQKDLLENNMKLIESTKSKLTQVTKSLIQQSSSSAKRVKRKPLATVNVRLRIPKPPLG